MKPKALVVDDEFAVRSVSSQMLEALGFDVFQAETGSEGLTLYIENQKVINLVLLDLSMPDRNGDYVLEKIREISKDVCVIIASGFYEEGAMEKLIGLGSSGLLRKPFPVDDLIKLVRQNGLLP